MPPSPTPPDHAPQRPAMDALRESEERFRTVFMQAPIPQALATIGDWRLVAANDEYHEAMGYSPMELLTRCLPDLTHPDDWPGNLRVLEEMLREGVARVIEKRYVRADGTVRYVRNHLQLIDDDHGAPRYVHALSVDLTPLHEAESGRSFAEARLRSVLEDTEDIVLVLGGDGAVRWASHNCAALAPALALPGASIVDMLHPGDVPPLRDALADALLSNRRRTVQLRGREACNSRHWRLRVRGDGEQGLIGVLRDVTERVVDEQVAEGEGVLMRRLLAGAPRLDILDGLARLMESVFPGLLVTVMLLDDDGSRMVYGAAPSVPETFVQATNGLPISRGVDVPGRITFRDKPEIVEDLWSHPATADYVHLLRPAGLRSCWSMPIHGTGAQQVGVLTMFGNVPRRPEPRQWRLAQRLATLAGVIVAGAGAGARDDATVQIAAARAPEVLADLTEREADVLRLVALGHTNQEIAEQLYLSVRTVEAHRAALHRKLRTKRRADLVQAALSGGLLHP